MPFVVPSRFIASLVALGVLLANIVMAQSTEGMISGRVTDAITGQSISGVALTCVNLATHTVRSARTGPEGVYAIPLLPPGTYQIQVSRAGYQAKEQDQIQLGVADSLYLSFSIRPLKDIWESATRASVLLPQQGTIVNFHGPDVDPNHWTAFAPNLGTTERLEASLSDAVSPADIRELPLNGENIYAVLLAEPGVTADSAASRSLGIAANGQRPSSSSFLLDGAEANFYLVSGPVLTIAPEATQEYRLSTNNYSAEYGGASGYIANAVSRSGGDQWHGLGFFDLQNTVLDANEFQNNLTALPRTPSKQDRIGGFAGGPIWKSRLFSGTSVEYFRNRSQMEPFSYKLPNAEFVSSICPANVSVCPLLRDFPVSNSIALDPNVANVTLSQPISVNEWLALQRFDYSTPGGLQHVTLRFASSNLTRPDFIWSPYRDFVSGMERPVYNLAMNWTATVRPTVTNQWSAAWNDERLSWARAHPEVPTLVVTSGNAGAIPLLPGSPAAYGLNNSSRYLQTYDNVTVVRGRHILKIGAGGLWRRTNDFLGFGLDGEYEFCNILHFGRNLPPCNSPTPPIEFTAALDRGASSPAQPDLARAYQSSQYFAFAEDTFKVTRRLVFDFGLRYDRYDAPAYAGGARDWTVQFGAGATFDERLANAYLAPPSGTSSSVFSANSSNWAPRTGFAYELLPSRHTTLRGGFGLFYDRLFDNLWLDARSNSFVFPSPIGVSGLLPIGTALAGFAGQNFVSDSPKLTAFQPHLHNGYAEDFFLGIQTEPTPQWSVEMNGAGSLGRRLITNDQINRNSLANSSLAAITYLSNQGLSDYYSLNLVTRWRARYGFLQAAYTWSHAIDLQSDPLAGTYFDLDFVNVGPAPGSSATAPSRAAFSTPNDSRGDRGNADFDQRHTLVFYSRWQVPRGGRSFVRRVFGGLSFSQIAGIRSGFPYSIFTAISPTTPTVINAYARPYDPAHALLTAPQAVPGGERLFDASAFCPNDACPFASSSRNAFAGPGLINLDVSASRTFGLRWLGDEGALTIRADAFNFLNHANLNPPGNLPGSNYGIAQYGSPPQAAGFPSVIPLGQTARQIQLRVRVSF